MQTKRVNQWRVSAADMAAMGVENNLDKAAKKFIEEDIARFLINEPIAPNAHPDLHALQALLNRCFTKVEQDLGATRWVQLDGKLFYDKQANGVWPIFSNTQDVKAYRSMQEKIPMVVEREENAGFVYKKYDSGTSLENVEQHINAWMADPVNEWKVPRKMQLLRVTKLSKEGFSVVNGYPKLDRVGDNRLFSSGSSVQGYDCHSGCLIDRSYGCSLPFLPIQGKHSARSLMIELLNKRLVPLGLADSQDYNHLLKIFHNIDCEALLKPQYLAWVDHKVSIKLLNQEKIRADISPYLEKMLTDTEQGVWDLWDAGDTAEVQSENRAVLEFSPLVARDPNTDINNGVVGIDFGTKSTVVVYQKDNVNIHPMRVGTGDLSQEISSHHYENPTVMEFNDLNQFISAYEAKAHKPNTRWQDLTISHTALSSMLGSTSSHFNTFLDEIKQWAGDKTRHLKVVGKQGRVIDLPPFLELEEDDFNPIEIYAYYLGLYINNQNNGIYLDYILSFPVTYEAPIRDKIIESFEKGIRKSLPEQLSEENLQKLSVVKGASEPAAYAITALQSFEFDPEGDERVFYSVFDFGGGTTDFDFGVFREANGKKERRFDYVIEHFGAGGDRYLGGENLLELLAFSIFKDNKTKLLANKIQFEKYTEADAFAGSEALLSISQEAKSNTKTLCEILRPYWEGDEDRASEFEQGSLNVNLTDSEGKVHTGFELDIDKEALDQVLSARIEKGVINFFEALRLAFSADDKNLHDIQKVHIFLAGNSSQSKYVKQNFDKHIHKQLEEMGREVAGDSNGSEEYDLFKLYSPLGSSEQDVEKPTGKTGVAFGLVNTRKGGKIKVVDLNISSENDIRFKFYLGEERKGKLKPILDRDTPFNRWIEFIDASEDSFEIFYTEQPAASRGDLPVSDQAVKKRIVKLDTVNDDAMVYIRIVSPSQIEYVVALEDQIDAGNYLTEIQSELLN